MTNAEKFEEVFGVKPDTETMVLECTHAANDCVYFSNGCHCERWWKEPYEANTLKQGDNK